MRIRKGLPSSVLNIDTRAPASDAYIKISGVLGLLRELVRHAYNDWELNVHTNGHNWKSWVVALMCGLAAQIGPGATLTLHSGLAPGYLRSRRRRGLAGRLTCRLYGRVVCVNQEIAEVIASLGIPLTQLEIAPAFLPVEARDVRLPAAIESWLQRHSPVIAATMCFQPEYGFEVLARGVEMLRKKYPGIGCLIMGGGENRPVHNLGDTILMAGDVDHEMCMALMARSSVFVRPTFTDGDSISVREALELGIPVVASNVGTRPDGTLLFEAGDVSEMVSRVEKCFAAERGKNVVTEPRSGERCSHGRKAVDRNRMGDQPL